MKFITKVYHPNVSFASGTIFLDILKDAWSPVLALKSTLISLSSLLCPEPNDPQDAEVAKHYMTSRSSFETLHAIGPMFTPASSTASGQGVVTGKMGSGVCNEVTIADLERAHADQFEAIGFERGKVVRVPISL
jgi:ubiquitin-conjugating enzyme (huntingtin interacting protein 2)